MLTLRPELRRIGIGLISITNPVFQLMPAGDSITLLAQILRQFQFHLHSGFERHGVEDFVEFGKEAETELLDDAGGFDSVLVIGEAFSWIEPGHADVNARFLRVTGWIGREDCRAARGFFGEEHDVDMVMMRGGGSGTDLAKGAAAH